MAENCLLASADKMLLNMFQFSLPRAQKKTVITVSGWILTQGFVHLQV